MERFALVLASLMLAGPAVAQSCSRQSPPHTVALLELYTSEGCSSCPPADRFVSGLHAASGLTAEQVVPLALHVDYWDYIGWKDRFARRDFTERQRWLSAQANSRTVYTPEIFMGGREWRQGYGWRGDPAATIKRINARPAQARIEITLGKVEGGKLPLSVKAGTSSRQAAQLFVALYENGLKSEVKTGENGGTVLHHDYVVREWLGPVALAGEGSPAFVRTLALPPAAATGKLGVAAFVQNEGGEILQALSLPLCAN